MINWTNDSTLIKTEAWFLAVDTIMIISTTFSIISGVIFLFIAITHKTCWSIQMILICHSCLAEVLLSCFLLNMAIFTFEHDLYQTTRDISFCITLGFLVYITDSLQNYSYLLTAIYRYMTVVYPTRILWKSAKFQVCLIIGQWIFCIIFTLPLYLTEQITYNIDNQICQVPLRLSITMLYLTIVIFIIPNIGVFGIYLKLTRYVHQMSIRTTSADTLFHARRELRLVQRTFTLANTLVILGIPYTIFVFISFFTTPPKYHFRIAYVFADISVVLILMITYGFTPQILTIIQKKLSRSTPVEPIRHAVRT